MILLLLGCYLAGVATCILAFCWAAKDWQGTFTPTIHQALTLKSGPDSKMER